MGKNKLYWIEAADAQTAFDVVTNPENIEYYDVINRMLKLGKKEIDIEYGLCDYYEENLDCIPNTKGVLSIEDIDLQVDWFDIAVDLYKKTKNIKKINK